MFPTPNCHLHATKPGGKMSHLSRTQQLVHREFGDTLASTDFRVSRSPLNLNSSPGVIITSQQWQTNPNPNPTYMYRKIRQNRNRHLLSSFSFSQYSSDDDEDNPRWLAQQKHIRKAGQALTQRNLDNSFSAFFGMSQSDQLQNKIRIRKGDPTRVALPNYGANFQPIPVMTKVLRKFGDITRAAFFSRILVFILQYFTTGLLPKHENDGFRFTPETVQLTVLDNWANTTFSGFANWDGQYFLHIALNGYTEEKIIAFFPLFPLTVGIIARAVHFFLFWLFSLTSVILMTGLALNLFFFVESAKIIYDITIYSDRGLTSLASLSVLLFCYNPASIFFSAFYSESLFAYLTVNCLQSCYKGNINRSIVFASLSAVCRSNGILNFGIIAAFILSTAVFNQKIQRSKGLWLIEILIEFVKLSFAIIPFALFQTYAIWKFCHEEVQNNLDQFSAYCAYTVKSPFQNLPYNYIQKMYWNVGFMKYFELKQIPNFLLAIPVLWFLGVESWKRFRIYLSYLIRGESYDSIVDLALSAHGVFLTLVCFFNTHVQVSTRLIMAACPYIYVYLAKLIRYETVMFRKHHINFPISSFFVCMWIFVYFVIGSILFSLGLPWT